MIIVVLFFVMGFILGLGIIYLYCIYRQFKNIDIYESLYDCCNEKNCDCRYVEKGEN